MFERLTVLGLKRAETQRAQRIASLAERAAEDVPAGVNVEAGPDGVVLSGRGLRRRWLDDARLRGVGMLLKGVGR